MTATSKVEALRFSPTSQPSSSAAPPSFRGHTLLLPTISHASIPQLATDLLLSSGNGLCLSHIGSLDVGQDLIPFVGGSDTHAHAHASTSTGAAAGPGIISTPLDVYTSSRYPLTVLQQRSPVLRSRRAIFAKRLAKWARQEGFGRVLVLSSLDAALKDDHELGVEEEEQGGMMHYLSGTSASAGQGEEQKKLAAALKKAGPPVSKRVLVGGPTEQDVDDAVSELRIQPPSAPTPPPSRRPLSSQQPHLPSSSTGLTSRYLSALSSESTDPPAAAAPVPCGALLLWAAEGENRGDAHRMARCVLDEVLPALGMQTTFVTAASGVRQQQQLEEPPSWRGLYGNAYDQALFG